MQRAKSGRAPIPGDDTMLISLSQAAAAAAFRGLVPEPQ